MKSPNPASATPADVVPPTPQAQTPNVGGTPSLGSAPLGAWTPGPWRASHLNGEISIYRGGKLVVNVATIKLPPVLGGGSTQRERTEQCEANARLISLAPELAEALRDASIAAHSSSATREECQALIVRLNVTDWDEARKAAAANARALLSKLKGS